MAKILVIGGTQFIGRHVVQKLLAAHHSVSLFNRGKTSPHLFPELPRIQADRESSEILKLPALRHNWDAVIDLSAYFPKDVANMTQALKGFAGRYIFCSTVSAYEVLSQAGPLPIIDEDSPLLGCTEAEAKDPSMTTYGQRKAECERVAMKQSESGGIPAVILRPCLVYGAHDHTDRFAYWIWRASRNEPFILPDDGLTITRRTYAPDLAQAFVSAIESSEVLGKAYNIAETDPLSFRDSLYWIGKHLGTDPLNYAVSLSSEILLKEKVKPWSDLPAWLPKTNLLIDTFQSRKDLKFVSTPAKRALADAADDFLLEKREPKTGLALSTEQELIAKYSRSISQHG